MTPILPEPLVTCLNPFATPQEREAASASIDGTVDWSHAVRILGVQRLQGMAWKALSQASTRFPAPPEVEQALKLAYHARRAVALRRLKVVHEILKVAAEGGIPVMVVKGPALVEALHEGDYGVRPFGDVDLAVVPEHAKTFLRLLNGRLCVKHNVALDFGSPSVELLVEGEPVELHWNLAHYQYAFRPSKDSLDHQRAIWRRSSERDYGWGRFHTMSPADMAHFVAWHSVVKHDLRDRPLSQLIDYLLVFKTFPSLSGRSLYFLSKELGVVTPVEALAYAACTTFDLRERCEAMPDLAASATHTVRRFVRQQLKMGNDPPKPPTLLGITAKSLTLAAPVAAFMDGLGTRVAFARLLVLPTRAFLSRVFTHRLSLAQYTAYLLAHPFLFPFLIPALRVLLSRQIEDCWRFRARPLEETRSPRSPHS